MNEELDIKQQLMKNSTAHFHSDKQYTEEDDAVRMELIKKLEKTTLTTKQCDCLDTLHEFQIIGSYARPNPDCVKCGGTGYIDEIDEVHTIEDALNRE